MATLKQEERRVSEKRIREELGAALREEYNALPMPSDDLLDRLMERIAESERAKARH